MKVDLLVGGEQVAHSLIDPDDWPAVAAHQWYLARDGYAYTRIGGKVVRLHRHILGLPTGSLLRVDHINRDKLDNRRENLRTVSDRRNTWNRRQSVERDLPVGVRAESSGTFSAWLHWRGRKQYLGTFPTAQEAHAYFLSQVEVVEAGGVPSPSHTYDQTLPQGVSHRRVRANGKVYAYFRVKRGGKERLFTSREEAVAFQGVGT